MATTEVPFRVSLVPPSPEAAALAAYADIPVDLYTGVPEITLPLYELRERDLALPVSLSYHASAHKVEDDATRAGLGWVLNAGGLVARSTRGLPDEYHRGGFLQQAAEMGDVGAYALGTVEQRYFWYDAMARGCRSAEPDIYFVTVGGLATRFQFDWDGSIHVASGSNLQISPIGLDVAGEGFIEGWTIVTPDGVRWTFDVIETVAPRFHGGALFSDPCRTIVNLLEPPQAWHLTEIRSPRTGGTIRFSYSDYQQTQERWSMEVQSHDWSLPNDAPLSRERLTTTVRGKYLTTITTGSGDATIEVRPGPERTDVTGVDLHTLGGLRVRDHDGDVVKEWVLGHDNSVGKLTLRTLQEVGDGEPKPPFRFDYSGQVINDPLSFHQDHWGFENDNTADTLIPRMTAQSAFNQQLVVLDGADRTSSPTKLTRGLIEQITYPTGGTDRFVFEPHDYSFEQNQQLREDVTITTTIGGAAPSFDTPAGEVHEERTAFTLTAEVELHLEAFFVYGMLVFSGGLNQPQVEIESSEGVIYRLAPPGIAISEDEPSRRTCSIRFNPPGLPSDISWCKDEETGATTPVTSPILQPGDYELVVRCRRPAVVAGNGVTARLTWEAPTGEVVTPRRQGAGTRVAQINRHHGFGNPDTVTTYNYTMTVEDEEISSGSLLESYYVYANWMVYYWSEAPNWELKYLRFSQNRAALGTTRGSHVGYASVTVTHGTDGQDGTSVYHYTSAIDHPDVGINLGIPFAPPWSMDHLRGHLLERTDHRADDGAPVHRTTHDYEFFSHRIPALKVGTIALGEIPDGPQAVGRFVVGSYQNVLGYARISATEDHLFAQPDSFVTRTTYAFDEAGHRQLSRRTTTAGAATVIEEFRYPSDFPPGTDDGLDALVDQHSVATVVEEATSTGDGAVVSATRRRYQRFGARVALADVDTAAVDDTVVVAGSVFDAVADRYELRWRALAYDTHGNVLAHGAPGGLVRSYIWDGPGTRLLAATDHALPDQVFHDSFEDDPAAADGPAFSGSRSLPVVSGHTLPAAALPRQPGDYLLSYRHTTDSAAPWAHVERVLRDYVPGTPIATEAINGFLDEVRLHPVGALMTTSTHRPLIGPTTVTDAAGTPTHYEYDRFGRLAVLRDRRGDILLHHEYGFAGGAEGPAGTLARPNHIRTYDARSRGVRTLDALTASDHRAVQRTTVYLDGMARPVQTVHQQASPSATDMVQVVAYDQQGREATRYLPYTAETTDGGFVPVNSLDHPVLRFYASPDPTVAATTAPFAQTRYDGSPLGLVVEAGAFGEAWQPGNGGVARTHRYERRANTDADAVPVWRLVDDELRAEAVYPPGALRIEITHDEHGGRSTVAYDGRERLVLRMRETPAGDAARSFFVYDERNNLTVLLPPRATTQVTPAYPAPFDPATIRPARMARECYRYTYDGRNRRVATALPGAQAVHLVYDPWDRLVLRQDGRQRAAGVWTFRKYDAHDRFVVEGETVLAGTREELARAVDEFYRSGPEELRFEVACTGGVGYSDRSFPALDGSAVVDRTVYFDDYTFLVDHPAAAELAFVPERGFGEILARPAGRETGSAVRVLGTEAVVWTATYYDHDGRQAQAIVRDHRGGGRRETIEYDIDGNVVGTLTTHAPAGESVRVDTDRVYDHAQRPTEVRVRVDDGDPVVVCALAYNPVGALVGKRLHSDDGGATFAQEIDYRYHVRGWLASINGADLDGPGGSERLFAARLTYEGALGSWPSVPQFNGNPSGMRWRTAPVDGEQAYSFRYDGFDRLTAARYRAAGAADRAFDETGRAYDDNGNLRNLARFTLDGGQRVAIDQLRYQYTGNQVSALNDVSGREEGFQDSSPPDPAYAYDAIGNMVEDRHRGLVISYHRPNLVDEVRAASGEVVRFGFDAEGAKWSREVFGADGVSGARRDYLGDAVVENGVLRLLAHDEGRVVRDGPADRWRFQYFLGDHLGSVRVAFEVHPDTGRPEIVYAADYYPSGLRIDRPELGGTDGALAARLFSGKEVQEVLGLGWYDFGARMLDPATGRWFVPDPAAERYPDVTPYGFVLGNPIRYLERDGRDLVLDSLLMRRADKATAAARALAGPVVQAVQASLSMLGTLVGRGPDVSSTTPPTPGKAAGGTVNKWTGPKAKLSKGLDFDFGKKTMPSSLTGSPGVEVVGRKLGIEAEARVFGDENSAARVTVGAETGAKATATLKGFNEAEVEVGFGAVAKGFVDGCLPGGFICGKVGGSVGPQIGIKAKIRFWPPNIKWGAKVGLAGVEVDVQIHPAVAAKLVEEKVIEFQQDMLTDLFGGGWGGGL